jgi:hypothetical protein
MSDSLPTVPPPLPDGHGSLLPTRLLRLEDRIVLDAAGADSQAPAAQDSPISAAPDAGTDHAVPAPGAAADAGAHAADTHSEHIGYSPDESASPEHCDSLHPRVLVVSGAVREAAVLIDAAQPDVKPVQFDPTQGTLEALLQQISAALDGRSAATIAMATHGTVPGGFELVAGHPVDLAALHNPELEAFWRGLAALVEPGGRIDLLACDAAGGAEGQALVAALEHLTGVNFAASTDATGNPSHGGDWLLETDGVNAGAVYFDGTHLAVFDETLGGNKPTITSTHPSVTAVGTAGGVFVDPNVTVDDGDGGTDTLKGAVVRIRGGFSASEDQLGFTPAYGITGSYNASTGELVLRGNASAAQYQEVLRSVTYANSSMNPSTTAREILITIGDDATGYAYNADTGHYYERVASSAPWAAANTGANARTLGGLRGYLATITSATENDLIMGLIPTMPPSPTPKCWLGAGDATTEGEWLWLSGPEAGQKFWTGGASGSVYGGAYTNWDASNPHNSAGANYLTILSSTSSGKWQDAGSGATGYIVEYGGLGTDAEGQLIARTTVQVVMPNHAPVLSNANLLSLNAIGEDHLANTGTSVHDIFATAGGNHIADDNAGAVQGLALTGADTTHGSWQYSIDGGATWHDVGAVSDAHALLLRDTDLLRFQPQVDWNGALSGALGFRAWDQTSGTAGDYADTTTSGGTTAFSTAHGAASIDVLAVNDAPVLDNSLHLQLTSVNEDTTPGGETIAHLLSSAGFSPVSDADGGALTGVAVVGLDHSHGTWEYSTDAGASWHHAGDVAADHALLLRDSDLLRFRPATDWNGDLSGAVIFRAWDRTSGSAGDYADTTSPGGSSAFSLATASAALQVNAVNDAPVVAQALVPQHTTDDEPFSYQFAADSFSDVDAGDLLTYTATLADGSALPHWLVFDPLTRTFGGTAERHDVGTLQIRVTAGDGHGGSAAGLFTLGISHVNHAPVVVVPLADQTGTVGATFAYQFDPHTFADRDVGDVLSYSATLSSGRALPAWLVFDPLTRTFTGTPGTGDVGTLNVEVVARDGLGGSVYSRFVLGIAAAPVVTPPSDGTPTTDPPTDGGGSTPPSGTDNSPNTPAYHPSDSGTSGTPGSNGSPASPGTGAPNGPGQSGTPPTVPGGASGSWTPGTGLSDFHDSGGFDLAGDRAPVGPTAPAAAGVETAATTGEGPPGAASAEGGSPAGPAAASGQGAVGAGAAGSGLHTVDAANAAASGGVVRAGANRDESLVYHRDSGLEGSTPFSFQVQSALLSGDLTSDESLPTEFRDTWNTILTAYADSGAELATYLQSAFRTVTEAACIYQSAEQMLSAATQELGQLAAGPAQEQLAELIGQVTTAREAVKVASTRLETEIQAAAQAGREERFDRVLEDVIAAALEQLTAANGRLYVSSETLEAATLVLQTAQQSGSPVTPEQVAQATAQAHDAAQIEIAEMRKSWDRVAQDVFSAFVTRLVAQQRAR